MEIASGAAATLPGAGTAGSFAIDAALMGRDLGAAAGGVTPPSWPSEGAPLTVHPNEAIMPLDKLMGKLDELIGATRDTAGAGAGGGEIVVKVMLDERQLGEAIAPIIDRRVIPRD